VRRLLHDPTRPIQEALLDQRNLAGIGNMYLAELCFTSGVHPATPVGAVPDLVRLVRRSKLMLEHNKTRATQSTTGDLREPFWVFRRDKAPCRRCGTPVVVAMLGPPGRERATYWCPSCQPMRG
jgi:endonuclease-8